MNYYESVFIVDPEWAQGDSQQMEKMVKDEIAKAGGNIHELKNQGRQRLAYPIRKRNHGCYFLVRFQAAPAHLASMTSSLKLNKAVIRHLVVKLKGPFGPVAEADAPEAEKVEV